MSGDGLDSMRRTGAPTEAPGASQQTAGQAVGPIQPAIEGEHNDGDSSIA
jgi:hypothetical protein